MTISRPPRPVLFDLDGTIADTIPLLLASMRAAYAHVGGRAPSDAEWLQGMGRPLRSQLREFEGDDPARIEALATYYRDWQYANLEAFVRPFADVRVLLDALHARGHPIAVVTGKGTPMSIATLELVGLMDAVPLLVTSEHTERHKPDPDPLLHALERLAVPADRALYVGDAPNDIKAARAAGMTDVWVTWGPFTLETLRPVVPTHVAYTPADIVELIDELDAREVAAA